jgi:hypothetical protein
MLLQILSFADTIFVIVNSAIAVSVFAKRGVAPAQLKAA